MCETYTHIKFGVVTNAVDEFQYVDIPKPHLMSKVDPKLGYVLDSCESENYRLIQYNPVCICILKTNIFNVKIVSGRVCIQDDTLIIAKKST